MHETVPQGPEAVTALPNGSLADASTVPATTLHARASQDFSAKLSRTQTLLQDAALAHAGRLTQASSLGAEDMVVSHLIGALGLDIGIFVLNTGMLHAQTLQLLARLQHDHGARVSVYQPETQAVVAFVAKEGQDAMYRSIALRKACCQLRKMEPLARALAGKAAWITGLRREQSGTRADVPLIDVSDPQRTKFNPLAEWTWGDVWHYIATEGVAYNPLHDHFYPSIGCEPCTRAIALGEDFRAGRWWWEDESAKECGLHAKSEPASETLPRTQGITA